MNNINKLYNHFQNEIIAVNSELISDLPQDISLLRNVFQHIFSAGGKRLRPLLTIAFSSIFGKVNHSTIYLATAVELIHTATLLHDDVIDNATMRRNIKTANNVWNNTTSILVGDNMFSKAFQYIVKSEKIQAFKELSDASAIISAAEVWQIQLLNKLNINMNEYIRLITHKTAVLFGAASAVGAITANASNDNIHIAKEFGINFGISYQIHDDLLDYFGNEEILGKEILQDIREGKVTLPLIILLQLANENEIQYIQSILASQNINKNTLLNLFNKYDIEQKVIDIRQGFISKALSYLDMLEESPVTRLLYELVF